jgi:hypothetical protein
LWVVKPAGDFLAALWGAEAVSKDGLQILILPVRRDVSEFVRIEKRRAGERAF